MPANPERASRRRKVSLPADQRELWCAKDIMLRWNISAPTFWRYRKLGLVPCPDRKIGMHPAWSRESVISMERQPGVKAAT